MSPKTGECKLCHRTGELRKSHFIPKAAYKLIQKSEGESPIAARAAVTFQTDEQITDYVLCASCENRFNKQGEAWVMKYCARSADNFRLKELIDNAKPIAGNGLKVYSAANILEISVDKLSYFAASIIWRAAVHDWKFGKQKIKRLYLGGRYVEELRQYLLGETGFPQNAVVWVSIIPESKLWGSFVAPYGEKLDQCWRYKFPFLGISFMFFLGKLIDPQIRRMCTLRSDLKLLYTGDQATEIVIRDLNSVISKSRPVGALAKRIQ